MEKIIQLGILSQTKKSNSDSTQKPYDSDSATLMPSAWDMDGRWRAYPSTVLMERQTLWIIASYVNWVFAL